MSCKILIVQGHPDPAPDRFCRVLAATYRNAAASGGHSIDEIDLAGLDFPLLRTREEWTKGQPPPAIADAQARIRAADHLVIFYPMWLGAMPALLKGFLEQTLRPGFALSEPEGRIPEKLLKGKSARIVVTMGMPATYYRLVWRAHTLKSLQHNILNFCGIRPVRTSLVGMVQSSERGRARALSKMKSLGRAAR